MAISDCVYRAMYRTRYLVIQDLDELIVPLRTESLAELVHSVDAAISADGVTSSDSLAAYNFRNLFFPPNGPNDPRFGPNSAAGGRGHPYGTGAS